MGLLFRVFPAFRIAFAKKEATHVAGNISKCRTAREYTIDTAPDVPLIAVLSLVPLPPSSLPQEASETAQRTDNAIKSNLFIILRLKLPKDTKLFDIAKDN